MEHQTEAQARSLEPTLGNAASPVSRRAVVLLARLPPEIKENRLACYSLWDLGNLVRCALAAGASANARSKSFTPVLNLAAQEGSARALTALLTGGADVLLADKTGHTALPWPLGKATQTASPCYWRLARRSRRRTASSARRSPWLQTMDAALPSPSYLIGGQTPI